MDEPRVRAVLRNVLRVILAVVVLSLLVLFAAFVWPTRYRYDHMTVDGDVVPVRIDRVNGDADMLLPDQGWVPAESTGDDSGPTKAGMGS